MFQVGSIRFEQPILLAPMEDVTERPFRLLCRRYGADMVYTEFVSSEGLIRAAAKTRAKIALAPEEHPVGIQIYGNREEALVEAAQISEAVGPELIDINFGCPAKKIACKVGGIGAGAGLLQDPDLLVRLAAAVVRSVRLPVTVKTRLGWDNSSIIIEDLACRLEDAGVQAIAIHARTRCQAFKGQADWSWIARVKRAVRIPVIGNGDVREPSDIRRMFEETGCDAVMIGRAAVGNPWIFSRAKALRETGADPGPPDIHERITAYLGLLDEAVKEKGEPRGVLEMRKHLSGYLKDAPSVSSLRARLMEQVSRDGVRAEIQAFVHALPASAQGHADTLGDAEACGHEGAWAGGALELLSEANAG
jgi:tRNA-dihydrouridine synthase B